MHPVTFRYNVFQTTWGTIFIFPVTIIISIIAFHLNTPYEWLAFLPFAVIIFCIIRFFILNFSLPMFKGKSSLILTDEKLVSNIQDETIYWKDVVKFSKHGGLSYSYFLFEMKNGDFIRIGTKWVEGSTREIYDLIQLFMATIPPAS